jgi:putative intracellular protease/amidase
MQKEVVHVAVYDTMVDWEVGYAIVHIRGELGQRHPGRYDVRTVGESLEPVSTGGGMRIVPDLTLDRLEPDDSAMLILPGAFTWEGGNHAFAHKARAFLSSGRPVAAICGATAGLAREGLMDDRDHTSNAPEFLASTGYAGTLRYRDVPAVTDRDLITAGAVAPVEFAREILARLAVYEPEVLQAWYRLYGGQDASAYAVLAEGGSR